jgi:hypothetical protein
VGEEGGIDGDERCESRATYCEELGGREGGRVGGALEDKEPNRHPAILLRGGIQGQ